MSDSSQIRRLNEAGIEAFRQFITSYDGQDPPRHLLWEESTSLELPVEIVVTQWPFQSRLEAGEYFYYLLKQTNLKDVEFDARMWAWLSLFYFDQLAPADSRGQRRPGALARWIPATRDWKRYYRHLLAGPWHIYRMYADNPEIALALLIGAVHQPGDIVEQLTSRQEFVTNRGIIEAATALYVDPETKTVKRGSGGKGPGSPRRLATVLKQFDLTYDLYSMSAADVLALLPREFNRFKPKGT